MPESSPNMLNIKKLHYDIMGAVFRPKDLGTGYKKIIENAIRDLSPDTKDNVIKLFESWEGTNSIERLKEILGSEKAEQLLKKIIPSKEVDLTDEDRKALSDILKDSLTFD
jgi:DNA-directed RNA polymerase subunit F